MDKLYYGCFEEDLNLEFVFLKGKLKLKNGIVCCFLIVLLVGFFCVIFYFWMWFIKIENDIVLFCCLKNSRLLFDVGIIILFNKWVVKFL